MPGFDIDPLQSRRGIGLGYHADQRYRRHATRARDIPTAVDQAPRSEYRLGLACIDVPAEDRLRISVVPRRRREQHFVRPRTPLRARDRGMRACGITAHGLRPTGWTGKHL